MMTTIPFNSATPAGRAITHLLDNVLADHVGQGIDVQWRGGDDRLLVVHPSLQSNHEDVTASLLMLVASIAGHGGVCLGQLHAVADENQRHHIAIAGFMAAGYQVGVPTAGKRRAS